MKRRRYRKNGTSERGAVQAISGERGMRKNPTSSRSEVRSPTSTRTEVRSPTSTRTEVRSPTSTSTSTRADTKGNFTVTGGAGAGNTTINFRRNPNRNSGMKRRKHAKKAHRSHRAYRRNPARTTLDPHAATRMKAAEILEDENRDYVKERSERFAGKGLKKNPSRKASGGIHLALAKRIHSGLRTHPFDAGGLVTVYGIPRTQATKIMASRKSLSDIYRVLSSQASKSMKRNPAPTHHRDLTMNKLRKARDAAELAFKRAKLPATKRKIFMRVNAIDRAMRKVMGKE